MAPKSLASIFEAGSAGLRTKRAQKRELLGGAISAVQTGAVAMLRDISQQGALIDTAAPLALGQQLRLEASGLPTLYAKVRWRQKAAHGLVFETTFRLDELARMVGEVQLAEPRPT